MKDLINIHCSNCNTVFGKEVSDIMEEEKSERGLNTLCFDCQRGQDKILEANEPQMKWEYIWVPLASGGVPFGLEVDIDALNTAGKDGWELAGIFRNRAFLKRPYYE